MSGYFILTVYFLISSSTLIILHSNQSVITPERETNSFKLLFLTFPALAVGFYFVALRPFESGGDTVGYIRTFNQLSSITTAVDTGRTFYGNTELLFWPLQAILKSILDVREWLIVNYFIVALLTYYAYKKIVKNTKISPLIFSLVFLTFFAVYSGNAMRQVYAIPLGVLAFYYAFHKNHLKFVLFSVLAMGFHWPAFIIILSPLFIRVPSKTIYYFMLPIISLFCSVYVTDIVNLTISLTGLDWLSSKSNLYLNSAKVSHIGDIWTTLNFWLCIFIYFLVFAARKLGSSNLDIIVKYHMMFVSLMLFGIKSADISERYMVWVIYLMPISFAMLLSNIKLPSMIKNISLMTIFIVMAVLVFTRESAEITLGINW
ncbi:hypothetical protein PS874_04489 [Pseudomonas fluorescens]|nr:hypothetical protein PS874_04489 [Pseudomonas fluorescens]